MAGAQWKDSESFKFASGEFAAVATAALLSRTSKESSTLLWPAARYLLPGILLNLRTVLLIAETAKPTARIAVWF